MSDIKKVWIRVGGVVHIPAEAFNNVETVENAIVDALKTQGLEVSGETYAPNLNEEFPFADEPTMVLSRFQLKPEKSQHK